ncbi:Chitin synthase, class 5 [Saccharomyces pastorianus]|uniref:Chitin biosynthesis protein CHS5 n=1 Tax=Saccharomyces pastorianus TaxID=27292 RepID=A0A6C1ECU0_SACPS|nr:Chitin synthase, class 5 [Saccharomyces pastorianus]
MSSVDVLLTVGKLDASLALLTTQDHHVIEFPTVLLPENVKAGSIIKMQVSQNLEEERKQRKHFKSIQAKILEKYGTHKPENPVLKIMNVTQTSCVLTWEQLKLGSAKLKSLILYRKGIRSMVIPNPFKVTTTKISGLSVDTPYEFQLKLITTSGTLWSEKIILRTHKMTDMSGITVCLGPLDPLKEISNTQVSQCLSHIGARPLQRHVAIDTTHFVCNDLDNEETNEELMKAKHNNIPIVRPEWVRACEVEKRIVGVRGFYLDADQSILASYTFPPVNEEELSNSRDNEIESRPAVENKDPEGTENVEQAEPPYSDEDKFSENKEQNEQKEDEVAQDTPVEDTPVEDTLNASPILENENTTETVNTSVRSLKSEPVGTPIIEETEPISSVQNTEHVQNEEQSAVETDPNEETTEHAPEDVKDAKTTVSDRVTNGLAETEGEGVDIQNNESNINTELVAENNKTVEDTVANPDNAEAELEIPEVNSSAQEADKAINESTAPQKQEEDIDPKIALETVTEKASEEPSNEGAPESLEGEVAETQENVNSATEPNADVLDEEPESTVNIEASEETEEQETTETDVAANVTADDVPPSEQSKKSNNNKKKNKKNKKKNKKK